MSLKYVVPHQARDAFLNTPGALFYLDLPPWEGLSSNHTTATSGPGCLSEPEAGRGRGHRAHGSPYTRHPTPSTLHPQPYTLNPTPSTLHPTPYTRWWCYRTGQRCRSPRRCSAWSLSLPLFHTHTHSLSLFLSLSPSLSLSLKPFRLFPLLFFTLVQVLEGP